jgi:carboxymethylenebutenolidase
MNDMQQYLVDEFVEAYRAGRMTRREALRRVMLLTGSAAVAGSLIGAVTPVKVAAEPSDRPLRQWQPQVSPSDPALRADNVVVPSQSGFPLAGYAAQPVQGATHPGILVIHENRGGGPHYEDVVRRYARAGYVALVIDLLSRAGGRGAFADEAAAIERQAQISDEQHVRDLNAAITWLRRRAAVQGDKIGVTGFCFGGAMTWRVALTNPAVRAAVPYYGPIPPLTDLSNLQAAMLCIYAGDDPVVNGSPLGNSFTNIVQMEVDLERANKTVEVVIERNAVHAFFNDSEADTYNAAAATDAWRRTLEWFRRYLS